MAFSLWAMYPHGPVLSLPSVKAAFLDEQVQYETLMGQTGRTDDGKSWDLSPEDGFH